MEDEIVKWVRSVLEPALGELEVDSGSSGLRGSAFAAVALALAGAMARRDGVIADEERSAILRLLVSLGLARDETSAVVDRILDSEELTPLVDSEQLKSVAPAITEGAGSLAWSIALEVAMADGTLDPREKALLDDLRAALPVDPAAADLLQAYRERGRRVPLTEAARLHALHPASLLSIGVGATHVAAELLARVVEAGSEHGASPTWAPTPDAAFSEFEDVRMALDQAYGRALEWRRYLPPAEAERIAEGRTLLAAGRFQLTVLGEFSRGKSTVVNALLGGPLLPRSVVPCNSGVVRLEYGAQPNYEIRAPGGAGRSVSYRELCDELFSGSTSDAIVRASAGVGLLEGKIALPHPLLAHGVSLVDTPGLNESAQLESLVEREAERSDAFVLVISAIQPMTRVELDALTQLGRHAAEHTFVVCNFMDLVPTRQRPLVEARVREALRGRIANAEERTFFVSGERALADAIGDEASAEWSGTMGGLRTALTTFLARERGTALLRRHYGLILTIADRVVANLSALEERQRTDSHEAHAARVAELQNQAAWLREQVAEFEQRKRRLAARVDRFVKELAGEVEGVLAGILTELAAELPVAATTWTSDEPFLMPWAVAKDFGGQAQAYVTREIEAQLERQLPRIVERLTEQLARDIGHEAAEVYAAADGVELGAAGVEISKDDPESAGMRLLKAGLGLVLVGPAGLMAGAASFTDLIAMTVAAFVTAFVIAFFGGGPITVAIGVAVSAVAVAFLGREGMKRTVRDKLVSKLAEEIPAQAPEMREKLRSELAEKGKEIRRALEGEMKKLEKAAEANLRALEKELAACESAGPDDPHAAFLSDELQRARAQQEELRVIGNRIEGPS